MARAPERARVEQGVGMCESSPPNRHQKLGDELTQGHQEESRALRTEDRWRWGGGDSAGDWGEENQGSDESQSSMKERMLGGWTAVSISAAELRTGDEERSLDLLVSHW